MQSEPCVFIAVALLVASLAATGWSVRYIRRSRRVPGRDAFELALLGNLWWISTTLAQVLAPDADGKILASQIAWLGNTAAPLYWGLSIHSYASGRAQESRGALTAVAVFAVFALVSALTNDLHHGIYTRFETVPASYGLRVVYHHGWLFWTIIAVCYAVLASGMVASLKAARGASRLHRRQFRGLIASILLPWAFNALTLSMDFTIYGVDPEPFGFLVSSVVLTFVFSRERLFVVGPIAGEVLFEAIPDPVFAIDAGGCILDLNGAARALPGMSAEPVGAPIAGLPELVACVEACGQDGGGPIEITVAANGRAYDVVSRSLADRTDGGRLLILRDVTESRAYREELVAKSAELQERLRQNDELQALLRRQAEQDPLTGLHNRRHAQDTLPDRLAAARREGRSAVLVLLDLDHFKAVNDGWGHPIGDEVLRRFADVLRTDLPDGGDAYRHGGEEFLVLLPDATNETAKACCARWRDLLGQARFAGAPGLAVTFSAGIAVMPDDGEDLGDLVRCADVALYAAKISGRDRVVAWGEHTAATAWPKTTRDGDGAAATGRDGGRATVPPVRRVGPRAPKTIRRDGGASR